MEISIGIATSNLNENILQNIFAGKNWSMIIDNLNKSNKLMGANVDFTVRQLLFELEKSAEQIFLWAKEVEQRQLEIV